MLGDFGLISVALHPRSTYEKDNEYSSNAQQMRGREKSLLQERPLAAPHSLAKVRLEVTHHDCPTQVGTLASFSAPFLCDAIIQLCDVLLSPPINDFMKYYHIFKIFK
jgi:hypothetical protein